MTSLLVAEKMQPYAIENIVSGLPRWQASFYRTANGAEIDLIVKRGQGYA